MDKIGNKCPKIALNGPKFGQNLYYGILRILKKPVYPAPLKSKYFDEKSWWRPLVTCIRSEIELWFRNNNNNFFHFSTFFWGGGLPLIQWVFFQMGWNFAQCFLSSKRRKCRRRIFDFFFVVWKMAIFHFFEHSRRIPEVVCPPRRKKSKIRLLHFLRFDDWKHCAKFQPIWKKTHWIKLQCVFSIVRFCHFEINGVKVYFVKDTFTASTSSKNISRTKGFFNFFLWIWK